MSTIEDVNSFNTQNTLGWHRMNKRVSESYGKGTNHPACVADMDPKDTATLAYVQAAIEKGEWMWVQLFGHTMLVPTEIADDVAGILNIGCHAIEDAQERST